MQNAYPRSWPLKAACTCGQPAGAEGVLDQVGPHLRLSCAVCGARNPNNSTSISKREVDEDVRSVSSRPDIKPSQRARILQRAGAACELCHRTDRPLHIGHFLSLKEGREVGASDIELYDDENLLALCDECNLGLGEETPPARMLLLILRARTSQSRRLSRDKEND